jgi:hypothetical protein
MDDDNTAIPQTLRSFFPVLLIIVSSIWRSIGTSMSHTSFFARSDRLNNIFSGGSAILFLASLVEISLSTIEQFSLMRYNSVIY